MLSLLTFSKSQGHLFDERHGRSLAKSITFRILVMLSDGVIIYAITHRFDVTLSVIIFSNLSSTIIYYLHERLWNKIAWGKAAGQTR